MKFLKGDTMICTCKDITERMKLLGVTTEDLIKLSFLDDDEIKAISENKLSPENMDQYHLALLSSVLHCEADYWRDDDVRKKDLLYQAMNEKNDNAQSIKVKARLQDFLNDFAFVCEVLQEEDESVYAETAHGQSVREAAQEVRKMFKIEEYPGNLFEILDFSEIIRRHQLLIFREDIGFLTGFTGYGANDVSLICINNKMSAEQQNFALAHELGHWMMHYGQGISDDNRMFDTSFDKTEIEADDFAYELLCPSSLFEEDCRYIKDNNLLIKEKRKDLIRYINKISKKYCLNNDLIFRKIMDSYKQKISDFDFDISDYLNDGHCTSEICDNYKRLTLPYEVLYDMVDDLASREKIGFAVAECIKYKNEIKS